MCWSGEKSEECHAAKTSNSVSMTNGTDLKVARCCLRKLTARSWLPRPAQRLCTCSPRNPVDLVLLDYDVLGIDGDVVAEHMKAGEADVPIALLSADDGLPESALKSVDAFVSTSESPANLLQIVEHLLDLRFLFTPLDSLTGGRGRRAA